MTTVMGKSNQVHSVLVLSLRGYDKPVMSLLGGANEGSLGAHCKRDILEAFWPSDTQSLLPVEGDRERCPWDAYFQHYTAECKKAIEADRGEHVTVRAHQDVIDIVRQLEDGKSKGAIKRSLASLDTRQRSEEAKDHMAEGSIRLAVRLFSMVDVGAPSKYRTWGPSFLPWNNEQLDLKTVLSTHFVSSSTEAGNLIFEEEFTVFNLQRFTGLEVHWTNNIADHLRLIDNYRKLCIFHHATFLQHQNRQVPGHPFRVRH
jgi:hypothetical protein